VIDGGAFNRIQRHIEHAANSHSFDIIGGGEIDESKGFYVQPTIVEVQDSNDTLMREEIFSLVLSVYVYLDSEVRETLRLAHDIDFGLTGAIFGQEP